MPGRSEFVSLCRPLAPGNRPADAGRGTPAGPFGFGASPVDLFSVTTVATVIAELVRHQQPGDLHLQVPLGAPKGDGPPIVRAAQSIATRKFLSVTMSNETDSTADRTMTGLSEVSDLIEAAVSDAADRTEAPRGFQTSAEESSGYRRPAAPPEPERGTPTPLPKRPKGRIAVGIMLLVLLVLVGHSLWSVFLRYGAYGLVTGRVAQVAAPWAGVVVESHASEAEKFQQLDLLARLDSLELRHQIERLSDELRMAQAELDAQVSRLRWEAQDYVDLTSRAAAQQHEAQGAYAEQAALLDRYERDRQRAEALTAQGAITDERRDEVRYNEIGQREKLAELRTSVEQWRRRAEALSALSDAGHDQLAPQFTKIESLQSEILRLREQLRQGELRAPFDAVVVQRHKLAGERVEPQEPVVDVLQTGSLEVVLYLSQDDVEGLAVGEQIAVTVEPLNSAVPCTVVRIGNQMESAPAAIERFYWSNEPLLPVYLKPDAKFSDWLSLRLGSMVKW